MEKFNLYSDPWIPTDRGPYPLKVWHFSRIECHPVTRLAIVRLMMAIDVWEHAASENDIGDYQEWFDLATAFQTPGLPVDSARHPEDIINMADANSVAWSPFPKKPVTPELLAQALVTAYFCDRGGLKARVPGLPISAQSPLHMGMRVGLKRGETIRELLDNNPVKYDGKYQPPWVTGLTMPKHSVPQDELELLLWPWRRIQVFETGITIAPGAPIDKSTVDPWVIDKAGLKHLDVEPNPETEITALVLNQAMPVACWLC